MPRRVPVVVWGLLPAAVAAAGLWYLQSDRAAATQAAPAAPIAPPTPVAAKHPRAVVAEPTFDLGVMHPGEERAHRFEVRNEGEADLVLTLGSTSCKCTLANLDTLRIPPGGADSIELEWHTEQPQYRFRQGAVINTNDPALPSFELVGEGSIRLKIGTLPDTVYAADVPRDVERSVNVLFYSQAFSDVEILSVHSTLSAVTGEISATLPTTVPPQETRFMRDLVVKLAPQSKPGHFDAQLTVAYRGRLPNGKEETGEVKLPVTFEVAGDVTLHGRDVVGNVLNFGSVSRSTGAKKNAYIHFRGSLPDDLQLAVRSAQPGILQVRVDEPQRLSPTLLRFPVAVEVPAGAPLQAATDEARGEVVLATNRPEDPEIRFDVSLIVVP